MNQHILKINSIAMKYNILYLHQIVTNEQHKKSERAFKIAQNPDLLTDEREAFSRRPRETLHRFRGAGWPPTQEATIL